MNGCSEAHEREYKVLGTTDRERSGFSHRIKVVQKHRSGDTRSYESEQTATQSTALWQQEGVCHILDLPNSVTNIEHAMLSAAGDSISLSHGADNAGKRSDRGHMLWSLLFMGDVGCVHVWLPRSWGESYNRGWKQRCATKATTEKPLDSWSDIGGRY